MLLLVLVVAPWAAPSRSVTPAAAAGCTDPFGPTFVEWLRSRFPDQRVTAAVTDTRTGCSYHLYRGLRLTTASVIKAAILGAVTLKAQDAGRGLSTWERNRIWPMITYSHNNPHVSDLYSHVGGVAGMDRFDRRMGATATTNSSSYGATWTTAEDRTRIALRMLHGGGALGPAARAEAWRSMGRVHPTQQWGITAGIPSGWSVPLKNGFYPMRGYGWRVGSTGFARHDVTGGGYAITVLSDRNGSQLAGMRLVEAVSRQVAKTLAGATPRPRNVDRSVCTETRAGESWGTVAVRVGLPASRGPDVRTVSGGNSAPLQGQRACSPYLR